MLCNATDLINTTDSMNISLSVRGNDVYSYTCQTCEIQLQVFEAAVEKCTRLGCSRVCSLCAYEMTIVYSNTGQAQDIITLFNESNTTSNTCSLLNSSCMLLSLGNSSNFTVVRLEDASTCNLNYPDRLLAMQAHARRFSRKRHAHHTWISA